MINLQIIVWENLVYNHLKLKQYDELKTRSFQASYMGYNEKKLLAGIVSASFGGQNNMSIEETKHLTKAGLIENGKITKLGRSHIRVILAGGVFDIIHPGHIHTLNEAKNLGDVLAVVVATDTMAEKAKKRKPLHTKEQRQNLVSSLNMVDICIVGSEESIFETVKIINPDVIALGYDQRHQEKAILDGCTKMGLQVSVARLQSPMPSMSSSKIKTQYDTKIHGI